MRNFSKTLFAVISFILVFAALSAAFMEPMIHSDLYTYFDMDARAEYAGTIDYIFLGASHIKYGIKPEIVDNIMGCNSYNLSSSSISWEGRKALLDEELSRNPVKTVVIEVSFDTLSRNTTTEGDLRVIPRLDSMEKRFKFFFNGRPLDKINDLFGLLLSDSKKNLKNLIFGIENEREMDYEKKGYRGKGENDLTLSESRAKQLHNSESLSLDFDQSRIDVLNDIVRSCKERNVNVVFVILPLSDKRLWMYDNWSLFSFKMHDVISATGCPLYDFNLIKNRYELFNDRESFNDSIHLSYIGARNFSKLLANTLIKLENGEDVSNLFYSSYFEMLSHSPYGNNPAGHENVQHDMNLENHQ